MSFKRLALAAGAIAGVLAATAAHAAPARNVVLVHGAFADGSGWKGVYDRLVAKGYKVSIVQEPETSVEEDVAATRRIIDLQDGPVILVGHSYGGMVITEAGNDPKVKALVYVAAIAADVGDTVASLNMRIPPTVKPMIQPIGGGFVRVQPSAFRNQFAADLPVAQAAFMAQSQVTTSGKLFETPASVAAWRTKPTYGVVAGADHTLNPQLERFMYSRAHARIMEVPGASHSVYISHPDRVAAVIEEAAAN